MGGIVQTGVVRLISQAFDVGDFGYRVVADGDAA